MDLHACTSAYGQLHGSIFLLGDVYGHIRHYKSHLEIVDTIRVLRSPRQLEEVLGNSMQPALKRKRR